MSVPSNPTYLRCVTNQLSEITRLAHLVFVIDTIQIIFILKLIINW